jgi:hypothetical protein
MRSLSARIAAARFARIVLNPHPPLESRVQQPVPLNSAAPTNFFTKSLPSTNNFFKIACATLGQVPSTVTCAPDFQPLLQLLHGSCFRRRS